MFCFKCGTPLGEGDRFCQNCGSMVPVIATEPEPTERAETQEKKPEKKHHPLVTTFGAISLLLGIVSLVCFGYPGISVCAGLVSFVLGIVAVSLAKRRFARKGMAVAGIVLSSVFFGIWLFALTLVALLFKMLSLGA